MKKCRWNGIHCFVCTSLHVATSPRSVRLYAPAPLMPTLLLLLLFIQLLLLLGSSPGETRCRWRQRCDKPPGTSTSTRPQLPASSGICSRSSPFSWRIHWARNWLGLIALKYTFSQGLACDWLPSCKLIGQQKYGLAEINKPFGQHNVQMSEIELY